MAGGPAGGRGVGEAVEPGHPVGVKVAQERTEGRPVNTDEVDERRVLVVADDLRPRRTLGPQQRGRKKNVTERCALYAR